MRISYTCPAHLKFSLTVEKWSNLVSLSGDAIDWLDRHEHMYDVWLLVAYSATSCALVQYHTWARRRDTDAQEKLKKLRDCVRRWEASISPDHMSARRKTAEIIALLYEATLGAPPTLEAPALNPTAGVKAKPPIGGLVYKKDGSRPGGGVFIRHDETKVPRIYIPGQDKDSEAGGQGILHSEAAALASSSTGGSSSMINVVPFSGDPEGVQNVNPAMNSMMASEPANVQVMNVLDVPQASNTLEQFAMADIGLLEGIPGGMFDWGQWDTFFSRFSGPGQSGGIAALQQHQQRLREMGLAATAQQPVPQMSAGHQQYPYSSSSAE
jgi:hypothetical protein